MLTWKSPLSIAFDVVFGVLPAIYFAVVSIFFLFDSGLLRIWGNSLSKIILLSIGLIGLITTLSLIYVIIARENTVQKPVLQIILITGVILAVFVPILLLTLSSTNQIDLPYSLIGLIAAVETPVVIVAIKHIYLLSRA